MDVDWKKTLAELGWTVSEENDEVTRLQRLDMRQMTYLIGTPQIHIHYLDTEEPAKLVEICCHGCGTGMFVQYTATTDPKMLKVKDNFQQQHRGCPGVGGEMFCQLVRTKTYTLDLRQAPTTN